MCWNFLISLRGRGPRQHQIQILSSASDSAEAPNSNVKLGLALVCNMSIDIYDITINIHQYIHQTHRPNGAAAEGGRPIGAPPKAAPVCLMDILMDMYGYIINIYGYISYTFLIYSIYIS